MRRVFRKYLGNNVPINDRIFYITSFTGAIGTLLFSMLGLLLGFDFDVLIICLVTSVISGAMFMAERKWHKTELFSHFILTIYCFFAFPLVMLLSRTNTLEIPIYYMVGLTFTLVLLSGRIRIIFLALEVLVYVLTIIYCFAIRLNFGVFPFARSLEDYAKIEFVMILSGFVCGAVIYYRNRLLNNEIRDKEAMTEKAEKISFAKDMFLVNVSHEIRTPLNAIIGTTDLLLDSDAPGHVKEMAYNISNSSHALLSITSDLLDFSRMNIDALHASEEKYDISVMLNDIINLMSVRLLDSNVEFYVDINPLLPKVMVGDFGKIRQILINMLSNAIKYTKEGHIVFKVDFDYEGRDIVKLMFSVEDTGIGIKEENLEKIFEAYTKIENDDTDPSTENFGIGLSLCRKLCANIDGELWVESSYGEGSTFFFNVCQTLETPYVGGLCGGLKTDGDIIIYYAAGDSEMRGLGKVFSSMEIENREAFSDSEFIKYCTSNQYMYYMISAQDYERLKSMINDSGVDWDKIVVISGCNYTYAGEPFKYVLTKPVSCLNIADLLNHSSNFAIKKHTYEGAFKIPEANVLVIDDNLVNLDVAASILKKYDANVITAASGKEGLIALKKSKIDIVFLDYMMPDMDGIDTLKEIRSLQGDEFKTLPVITLTANVVSGAKEMFINSGFDDYLSKPIEIDRLEKMLTTYLPSELIKYQMH